MSSFPHLDRLPKKGKRKASIFEAEEADSRAFLEEVLAIGREGLAALSDEDLAALVWRTEWLATARDNQLLPPGEWVTWLIRAGRGWGKTLVGAQDTGWYAYTHPGARCAVVGRTAADVRDTCFEGVSGLCTVIPLILVKDYHRSLNELVLHNKSRIKGFSAQEPDRLRGPQFHRAWCFPGTTSILMAEGSWQRLDQVREGGVVATREGPRRVLAAGMTHPAATVYRVLCVDGRNLDGTPDHPVWVVGRGWTPIGQLLVGDELCVVSVSSGEASAGTGTETRIISPTEARSGSKGSIATGFTERCTERLMARFRQVWTSTISITTSPITTPQTSPCYPVPTIGSITGISRRRLPTRHERLEQSRCAATGTGESLSAPPAQGAASCSALERLAFHVASAARRAWSVIAATFFPERTASAKFAGPAIERLSGLSGSAAPDATEAIRPHVPPVSSAMSPAANAARCSAAGALMPLSADGRARSLSTLKVAAVEKLATLPVYDLKVEGTPEFFANGILVHNCDEMGAWDNADDTWDMLQFGLRLGDSPQTIITTTPRPIDVLRRLSADPTTVITTGSTYDNEDNLAKSFFGQITQYEGTEIGRQEIHGEMIDPEEHGIFKRSWFRLWPKDRPFPKFEYIVMSLDTAFTEETINDPTACTIWGVFKGEDKDVKGWNVLLCDAWSKHLAYPALRKRAEDEYKCLYGDPGRYPDIVLIEQKGSGITLCQDLRLAGVPIRPYNPGQADKVQRAHTISHLVANGLCWLPESTLKAGRPRDWCEDFVNQVCVFPNSKRFDYVDTFTQCLRLLSDQAWLRIDKVESEIEEEPVRKANPYAA